MKIIMSTKYKFCNNRWFCSSPKNGAEKNMFFSFLRFFKKYLIFFIVFQITFLVLCPSFVTSKQILFLINKVVGFIFINLVVFTDLLDDDQLKNRYFLIKLVRVNVVFFGMIAFMSWFVSDSALDDIRAFLKFFDITVTEDDILKAIFPIFKVIYSVYLYIRSFFN